MVFVLIMLLVGLVIGMASLPDIEDDTKTAREIVDEVFEKLMNDTFSAQ